ncbi:MAG: hypothetical protein ABSA05_14245 [Opitutaceae bacterium]
MDQRTESSSGPEIPLTDRIRRWDDIRRSQFGVALTTFTALATGGIGYCAKLITDQKDAFPCRASGWFLAAACAFGLGLLAGVLCTWTRLWDARLTARKLRRQDEGAPKSELDEIQERFRFWGKITWVLLNALMLAVLIGIVCITVCVFYLYGDKLF